MQKWIASLKNLLRVPFEALDVKTILQLLAAGTINAFGVVLFLSPVSLYDSGFSGTSMLLSQITGLPLAVFLIVLNVPLFLYGLRKQGPIFTCRAIFAVIVYSLASLVFGAMLTGEAASPIAGSDLLLCALFGGIISGIGSGMTIRFGGAIDGIEVLAVIFARSLGLTIGTFMMIYNASLYIVAGILFNTWTLPLYSIVTYMAGLKTTDFIVEGLDRTKAATIITSKPDAICKELSDAFGSGITLISAKGYYSKEEKTMVYFVVNRFQIARMRGIVQKADDKAFISITEVSDLFSHGG